MERPEPGYRPFLARRFFKKCAFMLQKSAGRPPAQSGAVRRSSRFLYSRLFIALLSGRLMQQPAQLARPERTLRALVAGAITQIVATLWCGALFKDVTLPLVSPSRRRSINRGGTDVLLLGELSAVGGFAAIALGLVGLCCCRAQGGAGLYLSLSVTAGGLGIASGIPVLPSSAVSYRGASLTLRKDDPLLRAGVKPERW